MQSFDCTWAKLSVAAGEVLETRAGHEERKRAGLARGALGFIPFSGLGRILHQGAKQSNLAWKETHTPLSCSPSSPIVAMWPRCLTQAGDVFLALQLLQLGWSWEAWGAL